MDPKPYTTPVTPPPGYQQTMQNITNEQIGYNQNHQQLYHSHQQTSVYTTQQHIPMQPRMPPPIVNESG